MAHQVWRGSITFGPVDVAVRAFSATRDHTMHFHQIDRRDGSRIGAVVMRTMQYLAAIRPMQGALAMSTMRFADEVVSAAEVVDLMAALQASVAAARRPRADDAAPSDEGRSA